MFECGFVVVGIVVFNGNAGLVSSVVMLALSVSCPGLFLIVNSNRSIYSLYLCRHMKCEDIR